MKTRIIIGVLILTNILMVLFAFAQKVAADEQRELAEQSAQEAVKQHEIAKEQQMLAEANAEEAMRQQVIATENAKRALEAEARCK